MLLTAGCHADAAAEAIGVIADPEISSGSVSADTPFVVLASDGVFEFMQDQTVVDLVCPPVAFAEAHAVVVLTCIAAL